MNDKIDNIKSDIIAYVREAAVLENDTTIPLDESLLEVGILDSYGIIELISFIEKTWSIQINDDEITKEKMGSINKMAYFIQSKIGNKS